MSPKALLRPLLLSLVFAALAAPVPAHAATVPATPETTVLDATPACGASLALFAEITQTSTPALFEALAHEGGLAPFTAKPFHGYCRCSCSFTRNCNTSADCGGGACLGGITCC